MKKATLIAVLTLTLALFSGSLFAAGVGLTGIGARAMTLGGNYRAVADDWSAMFWNPAGMVFTQGLKAGVSLEFVTPTVGYTPIERPNGGQFSATLPEERENESKTHLLPSAGIYYSNEKFAIGLGFWAPFGLGSKWDLMNTSSYNGAYPDIEWEDDLKVIAIQPTFAYRLSEKLSVGVGVSAILADIIIRKPNFTQNPYIYNQALNQMVSGAFPSSALKSPFDHLLTESALEGDGMSFGVSLGTMYKITPDLALGASLRWQNTVALEGTIEATTYFADFPAVNQAVQGAVVPTLQAMLQAGQITQEQYAVMANYYSGVVIPRIPETDVKADMNLPMTAGVGLAYTGIRNLLISADVAWTQWSVWDVIQINNTDGDQISQLTLNWEDGIRVGIGMEYALGFGFIRGSAYTEPRAAVDETMIPAIPDFNRRNVVNIGFELPIGPLRLHAGYEKIFMSEYVVDEWVLTQDGTGYENKAGTYNSSINNMVIGFDYCF
ncbi:outer membrane protein transport protein [candidate division KSB1 bacterium]|nr:outer membrane protein transport protein [candidate division KSB1 bacterium]